MRPLRISLLTASLRGGGSERVQVTLAEALQRKGHEVTLLAFDGDGEIRDQVPADLKTSDLGCSRVIQGIGPLVRHLKHDRPNLVIAAMFHVGIVASISRSLARSDATLQIRLDCSYKDSQRSISKSKQLVLGSIQRLLLPRANSVIAVSNALAKEARKDYGLKNCEVVPNPVAIHNSTATSSRNAADPLLRSGAPIVVAIGRLSEEKGFSFLLRAFAELRKLREVKLLILGEGEQRDQLTEERDRLNLQDDVSLPGFVSNPFDYLRIASAYALSSRTEAFGLSVVEALSAGLPVIATRTSGPMDIINSPDLGELIGYGDLAAYSAALGRALDSDDRHRISRINRAADFAPDQIAEKYVDLYWEQTKAA
ncbi:MAG: glycosyltransferase [Planctomycetota bacterium]